MGTWSFPGESAAGACRGHGREQLYLYPRSGPHQACNGITLPLAFTFFYKYEGWNFNCGNAAVTFDTAHLVFKFSQTLDVLPNVM